MQPSRTSSRIAERAVRYPPKLAYAWRTVKPQTLPKPSEASTTEKPRKQKPPSRPTLHPNNEPNPEETSSAAIKQPVSTLIHDGFKSAWIVNPSANMCFIFDVKSPAHMFKRGMQYSHEAEFPMLTAAGAGDVTETDEDSPGLMPYMPVEYQWTYYIECNIAASQFMAWTEGELRPVQVGKTRKINNKRAYKQQYTEYLIPAPYDRIVSQLILEAMHGEAHDTHESHRRLSYAREVLDAFGQELEQLKGRSKEGMVTFRSAILTPLLQRQRRGVDDAYTPSVCAAIRRHASNTLQVEHAKGSLTIRAATNFYLKDDPTNPSHIPSYRRNLLYLPVARWHLGRVLGQPGDQGPEAALAYYKSILEHHDTIMESLHTEAYAGYNADGVPFLTRAEVTAILLEGIEAFFKAELNEQPEMVDQVRQSISTQ